MTTCPGIAGTPIRLSPLKADAGQEVAKAARSALWLPVPDVFWDANTKAVPSWMVTASSTRKPLPGGHCMLRSSARAPPIVMAWSVCGVARHGCAAAEARIVEQGLDDQVSRPAGREEQADQGDPSPDQTCRRCPRWSRHGRVGRSRWWTCRAVRGEPDGYGGRANKPRAALVTDPLVAFMRYWPMVMACPCSASVLCAGGGQPLVEPDGLVSVGTVRGEQRDG